MQSLEGEVRAYWQSIDELLSDAGPARTRDAYEYLESRVIPRRQAVVSLAEELADVSTAQARLAIRP